MRSNNPFLYIVQIVFGALLPVSTPSHEGPVKIIAQSAGTTSFHVRNLPSLTAQDYPFQCPTATSVFIGAHDLLQAPPNWHIYTRYEESASIGHGSTTRMRSNNPFLYIVQIVFGALLPVSTPSHERPVKIIAQSARTTSFHVRNLPLLTAQDYPFQCPTATSVFIGAHDLLQAPPNWHIYIYTRYEESASIGHGSTTRMRSNNPFLYIVQIVFGALLPVSTPSHEGPVKIIAQSAGTTSFHVRNLPSLTAQDYPFQCPTATSVFIGAHDLL
ncbi:hypothetical protein V5799_012655 [Amblyomma americanum]|uniref:Secreted protein n=1 Tax=Amblyomma americanum TaxID=6943 RepID=A0AAQ4EDT6_AMBAM